MTAAAVTHVAGWIALVCLLAAFAITVGCTLARGRLADRVLALDVLSFLAVALIAAVAYRSRIAALLDAAAVPALVGFIATAAFARHLERVDRAGDSQ